MPDPVRRDHDSRTQDTGPTPPRSVRFDLTSRTLFLILATILGAWLVVQLWTVVLVVIFALILVGTLNPLILALNRRGLARGWAVLLVFVGLLAVTSVLVLVTLPPLAGQVMELLEEAPARRDALIVWLQGRPLTTPLAQMVRDSGSSELITSLGTTALSYSSQALLVLGYAATSIILAFYILADNQRTLGGLYAVVPRRYHVRLARILIELEVIVGGYVRGQLITSGAIALFMFGLLTICGVSNALPIAVFAGLADVLPFVGALLAITPAALAALKVDSSVAILVLVVMIVYMEFESRILIPRVYGRVLRLSAATVIVALLIGGTLLGILGALLALPIAAGLLMIVRELRVEMPGDDSDHPEIRASDARNELAYAARTAGATPQEAAVIAADMARVNRIRDAPTQPDPPRK